MARAALILQRKWTDERGNLHQMVLWQVVRSVRYPEAIRYRLAFIRSGEEAPALLYDNHHPKGLHRHIGAREEPYPFVSAQRLVTDFLTYAAILAGEAK
jgi:hypothetical protein